MFGDLRHLEGLLDEAGDPLGEKLLRLALDVGDAKRTPRGLGRGLPVVRKGGDAPLRRKLAPR
jgi:hypothetical protein